MKVEIYSDVVCPWCYVGKKRFAKALEQFNSVDVEVVLRPFQLDPNAPMEAVPLTDYLAKRFGAGARSATAAVEGAGSSEGITFNWERALASNTRQAHRLLQYALEHHGATKQGVVADALFAAHFTDGKDIGDVDVLVAIGAHAGIDETSLRRHLASQPDREEFDRLLTEARERGVSSVPTFVFDGQYAVSGAQSTATFVDVLKEVQGLTAAA